MTGGDVVISSVGLIAGAVGAYVGLRLVPIEQHLTDRKEARKTESEALEKRIQGLHSDAKEQREKLEERIKEIEQSYVSRESMERTINAVGDRMDRGVARIEATVNALGVKVDHLTERVTRVEAS